MSSQKKVALNTQKKKIDKTDCYSIGLVFPHTTEDKEQNLYFSVNNFPQEYLQKTADGFKREREKNSSEGFLTAIYPPCTVNTALHSSEPAVLVALQV